MSLNGCESVKKAFLLKQTNLNCWETGKIYKKYNEINKRVGVD